MKYEIKEQDDGLGTHMLWRNGIPMTRPNNAELEFWYEIQRLRKIVKLWEHVGDVVKDIYREQCGQPALDELTSRVTAGALGPAADVNSAAGATQENFEAWVEGRISSGELKGGYASGATPLLPSGNPVLVHLSASQKEANA